MSATPKTASFMAATFLYSTLAADSQIIAAVGTRIYNPLAPEQPTYPLIVIQFLGAVPTNALGPWRTLTKVRYKVAVCNLSASFAALDPILDRIDTLLQGNSQYWGLAGVTACTQVQQVQISDPTLGRDYRELGNIYECIVSDRP